MSRSHRPPLITLLVVLSFLTGCAAIERTGTVVRRTGQLVNPRGATDAIRRMESNSADERRRGINKLVEYAWAREHVINACTSLAADDPDFLVRATAIRALNRVRHTGGTKLYIEALADANPLVRLEAAKALANMPNPDASAPLLKAMTDPNEDRDVRIAAADALKHYKEPDVVRALVAQLPGREFGVAWQARHSLRRITGKDLRYDDAAWNAYLASTDKPLG